MEKRYAERLRYYAQHCESIISGCDFRRTRDQAAARARDEANHSKAYAHTTVQKLPANTDNSDFVPVYPETSALWEVARLDVVRADQLDEWAKSIETNALPPLQARYATFDKTLEKPQQEAMAAFKKLQSYNDKNVLPAWKAFIDPATKWHESQLTQQAIEEQRKEHNLPAPAPEQPTPSSKKTRDPRRYPVNDGIDIYEPCLWQLERSFKIHVAHWLWLLRDFGAKMAHWAFLLMSTEAEVQLEVQRALRQHVVNYGVEKVASNHLTVRAEGQAATNDLGACYHSTLAIASSLQTSLKTILLLPPGVDVYISTGLILQALKPHSRTTLLPQDAFPQPPSKLCVPPPSPVPLTDSGFAPNNHGDRRQILTQKYLEDHFTCGLSPLVTAPPPSQFIHSLVSVEIPERNLIGRRRWTKRTLVLTRAKHAHLMPRPEAIAQEAAKEAAKETDDKPEDGDNPYSASVGSVTIVSPAQNYFARSLPLKSRRKPANKNTEEQQQHLRTLGVVEVEFGTTEGGFAASKSPEGPSIVCYDHMPSCPPKDPQPEWSISLALTDLLLTADSATVAKGVMPKYKIKVATPAGICKDAKAPTIEQWKALTAAAAAAAAKGGDDDDATDTEKTPSAAAAASDARSVDPEGGQDDDEDGLVMARFSPEAEDEAHRLQQDAERQRRELEEAATKVIVYDSKIKSNFALWLSSGLPLFELAERKHTGMMSLFGSSQKVRFRLAKEVDVFPFVHIMTSIITKKEIPGTQPLLIVVSSNAAHRSPGNLSFSPMLLNARPSIARSSVQDVPAAAKDVPPAAKEVAPAAVAAAEALPVEEPPTADPEEESSPSEAEKAEEDEAAKSADEASEHAEDAEPIVIEPMGKTRGGAFDVEEDFPSFSAEDH